MARIVASDRFVSVALGGAQDAVRRAFLQAAQRAYDQVRQTAQPTEVTRFVDGAKGRPMEAVRVPGGVIHWRFGYLRRIAEAGLQVLRETSPVDSGEYQREHSVYVDGARIPDPSAITSETRRVILCDVVPYARVIERGMLGQVPWSKQPQVPAKGVYRAAAEVLRRRFGHLASIAFTYVGADEDTVLGDTAPPRHTRFPAITVEAR